MSNDPCPKMARVMEHFNQLTTMGRAPIDIEAFPDTIIMHVFVFLPCQDIIHHCRLVCRRWRDCVDQNSLWKEKCLREGKFVPASHPRDKLPLEKLYFHNPLCRNLIKNWCGEENLLHWDVQSKGGDGFRVESNSPASAEPFDTIKAHDRVTACWATSYGHCWKSQKVELLSLGLPQEYLDNTELSVRFSEWTAARGDCASVYTGRVTLRSVSGEVIGVEEFTHREPQWAGKVWNKMLRVFPAVRGLRTIEVEHGGRDWQFWAGYYGPKITATSVVVTEHST